MSQYLTKVITKFLPLTNSGIPVHYKTGEIVKDLLSNPNIVYVENPGKGCVLGVVYPHFLNPDIIICQELGWWVEPEYRNTKVGISLYIQFEKAAKLAGAHKMIMICLESQDPDKVGRMYTKLGYRLLEHSYIKEV